MAGTNPLKVNSGVATKKLTHLDFVENAIRKLRNEKSKGIHVVYSKLNAYMTAYYGDEIAKVAEVVHLPASAERPAKGTRPARQAMPERDLTLTGAPAVVQKLIKEGKIDGRPVSGGMMVFLKGEMPTTTRQVNAVEMKTKLGL